MMKQIQTSSMQGIIVKTHSNFYYVKPFHQQEIYECSLRANLKKAGVHCCVGDTVHIEISNSTIFQAVINKKDPPKTFLSKPNISNVNLAILVISPRKPVTTFYQIDRYLVHTELSHLNTLICINKSDLIHTENDRNYIKTVQEIYGALGYKIIFTSTKDPHININELEKSIIDQTSILYGQSGVGKSSLINALTPHANLKTGSLNTKTKHGKHTTRHVELIALAHISSETFIADSPGFLHVTFEDKPPEEIKSCYRELDNITGCYYENCLHIFEPGCHLHDASHLIHENRLESYYKIIKITMENNKLLLSQSTKEEETIKKMNHLELIKISAESKEHSRKKVKQTYAKISNLKDAEYFLDESE